VTDVVSVFFSVALLTGRKVLENDLDMYTHHGTPHGLDIV